MIFNRIIPCLLIDNGKMVKTTNFKNAKYVGDPINAIKIFNEKEVDEIFIIDISSTKNNKEPNYQLIKDFSSECFMPITYGGGIINIDIAKKVFDFGIEKISIQNGYIENKNFAKELVKIYGSSSIVASVDIKKNIFGTNMIYSYLTKKYVTKNIIEYVNNLIDMGFGEIFFNFVDKDGTLSGPEFDIIKNIASKFTVPITVMGGISSILDIENLFKTGVSGIAAGSFFVYHGPHRAVLITYPSKKDLNKILYGK